MSGHKKPTELQQAIAGGRNIFWIIGLFSFFINLLMLVGPFYMLQVYDRVLTSGSIPTLIFLTIAAVGLNLVSALLEWLRSRILIRLNGRLEKSLRQSLFAGLFKSGGRDSQPLKDLETTRGFISGNGLVTFFDAPWAPIFLTLIFVFHPLLGFIATLGAVFLFLVAVLTELLTRKVLIKSSTDTGAANKFVEGALLNREVVMALGMLPGMYAKWHEKYEGGHAAQALAADRSGMLNAIAKFIRPVLQIAMLGTGAWLVLNQEVSPGVMIASSIVMGRALAPVQGAIGSWKGFVLARSAYSRLKEFYSGLEDVKLQSSLPKPKGHITVERAVGAPPRSEVPVIKGISFNIPAGSSLGIIGPSASGKSTLARLLTGVWAPTSGKVRLDGVDISKWDHQELGPNLGYLPQDVELFDGTVLDNINRFSDGDPAIAIEAAQKAGIHEMILALPNGYDTLIGPMGSVLSGGQRQRIGLARALYGNPALIVLDEPNSNLDSDGEEALKSAILRLQEKSQTLVIISHRPAIINVVDHVMILKSGMIEDFGTRQEVLGRMTAAKTANIRSVNAGS